MQGIKIGDYHHKMCYTIRAGENGTRQAFGHFTVVHRMGCPTPWQHWPVSRAPPQLCVCVCVVIIIIMVISLFCTERDVQLRGSTGQSAELHPSCVCVWCVCVCVVIIMVISLFCTERDVQLHGGTGQSAELHPG